MSEKKYTTAQRKKFFELVKEYSTASMNDEKAKDLSDRIKQLSKTPQGLNELAQLITEQIEDDMRAYDLRPMLFGQVKNRDLNEKVEYKRKGKFRAYRITRGGYVPKSQIFEHVVMVQPEEFAVRPACHIDQLETGKISSVQELRDGAMHAMLTEYARYFYAMMEEVIGDDTNEDNYAEVSNAVDKTTLDAMIHWAAGNGRGVTVVGTHQSLAPILDFAGYSDATKRDIERTGNMGVYRGANLVKLEDFLDADGNEVIQQDKIFIITQSIGHVDDFGEMRVREVLDPEHDEFSIIMRKQWGFTVLYPEKVGMIKIT
jgi:hypothetical protein